MNKKPLCYVMAFLLAVVISSATAYEDKITHPKLTENAIKASQIEPYLVRNLGFREGLETQLTFSGFSNKSIRNWTMEGSTAEDAEACRRANHMHNPLKTWDVSYMSDAPWWANACTAWGKKYSNVTWATSYLAPPPAGKKVPMQQPNISSNAPYNWDLARDSYYQALTSMTKETREQYFAYSFKTIGHVLHLLEDMAVPAHTRNDFASHLIGEGPYWGEKRRQPYEYYVQANSQLIGLSVPIQPAFSNAKLTDFWDTDKYNGSNPSTLVDIGLAEFSNANYFSDYTIYPNNATSTEHTFPYPYVKDSGIQGGYKVCTDISVGSDYNPLYPFRKYISRKTKGDICPHGIPATSEIGKIDHFAVVSLLDEPNIGNVSISSLMLTLDNNVHNTYAKELLPRAVGYSAGLLNYFFRGDIRLDYDITGPTPGYVIVNKTKEDMDGLFQIFYDNKNDQRIEFMNGNFGVKAENRGDIFTIRPPVDAKEPGKYILVFKGNMGNEKGAVAGYVNTRVLEITPPEQFIYSMADGSQADPYFTRIRVKVKNPSTSEQMQNGTVQAVAKYKSDTYDTDFIYSESEPRAVDLSNNAQVEVEFNFDNDPIPVDATDLYLEIVFKGTIGAETNATAIGIKDISEPTPIDLFNNTDRSCLNNTWYVSGSPEAIAQVDKDNDGDADDWNEWDVYPHILKNIYIKISAPSAPQSASLTVNNFVVPELDAGQFKRAMYILTDYQFKYSFNVAWERKGSNDWWGHSNMTYMHSGTALKNQTDYTSDPAICGAAPLCYTYTYPGYYSIRGNEMWWAGGIVLINSPYPATSSCQGYE